MGEVGGGLDRGGAEEGGEASSRFPFLYLYKKVGKSPLPLPLPLQIYIYLMLSLYNRYNENWWGGGGRAESPRPLAPPSPILFITGSREGFVCIRGGGGKAGGLSLDPSFLVYTLINFVFTRSFC